MSDQLKELCEFFQRLNSNSDEANDDQEHTFSASIEDVRKFDRFLQQSGGHTGGWDPFEHTIFVKLILTHTINSVIYIFRLNFPDITEKEILRHSDWYESYIKLKTKQAHAIRYWRLKKNESNSNVGTQNVTKVEMMPKANKNSKLAILKWKEERKAMREEIDKQREREQKLKVEEEKAKRLLIEKKRKIMLEQKKEKEALKMAEKLAKEMEEAEKNKLKIKRANKMLHLYRRKDIQLIENAHLKKLIKLQKEQEKQRMFELLASKTRRNIRASRDPIRLLIPTVEWMQKISKRNKAPQQGVQPTSITKIQHLATPVWRRGVK